MTSAFFVIWTGQRIFNFDDVMNIPTRIYSRWDYLGPFWRIPACAGTLTLSRRLTRSTCRRFMRRITFLIRQHNTFSSDANSRSTFTGLALTLKHKRNVFHHRHSHNPPLIGPIPWGHSGPLCHALSLLSLSLLSWASMRRRRATVAACDSSDTWWMAM